MIVFDSEGATDGSKIFLREFFLFSGFSSKDSKDLVISLFYDRVKCLDKAKAQRLVFLFDEETQQIEMKSYAFYHF